MDVKNIETKVAKVQHGFTEMREEAMQIVEHASVSESLGLAKRIYASDKYQARMVAVFVLGYISSESEVALSLLRKKVRNDNSWQVQEILAQAFNEYCSRIGYEKALPIIRDWLKDGNPNVKRAVTEGLRIWNQRDYFREHPEAAVKLLAKLKDDESEYVRRSVGNALRDISRKEKDLIRKELATWDDSNPRIKFTRNLAGKFL